MHIIYGIAKTIMDGNKDATQQLDFAASAKSQGKPEIAMKHAEEAKRRLSGVKEWHDLGIKTLNAEKPEPIAEAVMDLLNQQCRELMERANSFKPN